MVVWIFQVNSFVGAFHDAVLLYALALNETLADNGSISDGQAITRRMWNRTFTGQIIVVWGHNERSLIVITENWIYLHRFLHFVQVNFYIGIVSFKRMFEMHDVTSVLYDFITICFSWHTYSTLFMVTNMYHCLLQLCIVYVSFKCHENVYSVSMCI